ncbi:amidohydrolase family protein [Chitinimonas koreensis]|uniref:amidohydrolase family protein n=1 Tax=Chitinimonas koreensis TaxID=356302 RepID=UPI0003F4CA8D|nr:amidohydrolase family protein [Chitinimonas koreensis]QNM94781.1 amidohydrolase family protein [Chitinimonas koreensis]
MLDLLIRNALVHDGRGSPPARLAVGVRDGVVVHLAADGETPARQVIDAEGLWLLPGLVDIHTHYDLEVEVAPGLAESVRHGVTTVLMGNCSLSVACGAPADLADVFQRVETLPAELIRPWLERAVDWRSPADYLDHLDRLPLGPNVAVLLGHSALRLAEMGLARSLAGPATAGEIARMAATADAALAAGFCGLSVDMVHWHKVHGAWAGRALPSHHADYAEYAALAEVCRRRDAVFQVTPNPGSRRSVWHILKLGWGGPRRPPLRMTLLSALDLDTVPWLWRLYAPLLWFYNKVAGNNLRMQTLTEPFTLWSDGPITPLFEEFASGVELNNARDAAQRRALWAAPGFRARFAADWTRPGVKTFHRDFARIRVAAAPEPGWAGRSMAELAAQAGRAPLDWFMDALAVHDTALRWVASGANNRAPVRRRLMAQRYVLPGFTDAGAHGRNLAYFDGALSLLRQALQTGFMPPERAVARVSGEPAAWLGLDAGVLAPGRRADLLLLDPAALAASRAEPQLMADPVLGGAERMVNRDPAAPVRAVWIAGRQVVADGEPLPVLGQARCGRLLRPRSPVEGYAAVRRRYRDRIDDLQYDHGLARYWDIFVMKHQHPANIRLHVAAVLIMYGSALAALLAWNPWWLLGVPASNLLGQYGHARYEPSHVDGRDALFSWRAMAALAKLAALALRGRYAAELARVRAGVRP